MHNQGSEKAVSGSNTFNKIVMFALMLFLSISITSGYIGYSYGEAVKQAEMSAMEVDIFGERLMSLYSQYTHEVSLRAKRVIDEYREPSIIKKKPQDVVSIILACEWQDSYRMLVSVYGDERMDLFCHYFEAGIGDVI